MKLIKIVILFIPITIIPHAHAQNFLEQYVETGLKSNLGLLQRESDYRKSLEALREAKGLFYPALSLNARYTLSEGGRTIDFPVGDLLNPVYSTLNQLTASDQFPVVENQEIRFLRSNEHETKLRLVQPVFNSDLYYNLKIKKELSVNEEISMEQYKRELTTEIKKAYYSVGMASGIYSMLQATRQLLVENIRSNESLLRNNKITYDIVLRSQTELSKFDQQLLGSHKNRITASAYFNFLLNRNFTDSIIVAMPPIPVPFAGNLSDQIKLAMENREEIRSLEQLNRLSDLDFERNRSGRLPDIFIVADYGFQGERYEFSNKQDYLQASAIVSWDLFGGFQNQARIRQAMYNKVKAGHKLEEVKKSIELQVINAYNELQTSQAGLAAAEGRVNTAREGFRLVKRKYEEGQAGLIEFMDARNNLTQAEENLIISQYSYLIAYTDFENTIGL